MAEAYNGMPASGLHGATWRKSHYSNPNGSCVEVAELPTGAVAVRNSRHPGGPALIYTPAEVAAFIQGIKDGQFDDLIALRSARMGGQPWRARGQARLLMPVAPAGQGDRLCNRDRAMRHWGESVAAMVRDHR